MSPSALRVCFRICLWGLLSLAWGDAQTGPATPWAVVNARPSATKGTGVLGPSLVNAAGDLFVANTLVGTMSGAKAFGDTSTTAAWISKVSTSGGYAVQLGGFHSVNLLAFDPAGNLLIAGDATATGVPATSGAYRTAGTVDGSPVLCKLRAMDGTPLFCTYFDDTGYGVTALIADSNLNLNVVMWNKLVKLDPSGSTAQVLSIPTFNLIAADGSGSTYLAGGGTSLVEKMDSSGHVIWTSHHANENDTALTVDSSGQVYVAGTRNGGSVRKLSADGSTVQWETNTPVSASWIGIDSLGVVTLTGFTQAVNFPVHHSTALCPVQQSPAPKEFDGGPVLVRLTPDGELTQSTFFGMRGILQSVAVSATSAAGYVAWNDFPGTTLTVSQIGPDPNGTYATALGCVGNAALPAYPNMPAALSPGEIVSIFGEGLGPDAPSLWTLTSDNRVSSSLAGVEVTFDGVPAPLIYVQSSQINVVTPWSLNGKSSTLLCVTYSGKQSCGAVAVVPATPAIFTAAPSVNGVLSLGAAINQDGTLNTLQNPAPVGSVISLFLTGLGPLSPGEADGVLTPWPAPALAYSVQVSFSNVLAQYAADVLYAGPAPLAVGGLYQINVRVPSIPRYCLYNLCPGPSLSIAVTLPDGSVASSASVLIATTQ